MTPLSRLDRGSRLAPASLSSRWRTSRAAGLDATKPHRLPFRAPRTEVGGALRRSTDVITLSDFESDSDEEHAENNRRRRGPVKRRLHQMDSESDKDVNNDESSASTNSSSSNVAAAADDALLQFEKSVQQHSRRHQKRAERRRKRRQYLGLTQRLNKHRFQPTLFRLSSRK